MKTVDLRAQRELSVEEESEAQRIADIVVGRVRAEALELGRMLVSKSNGELFGETEFHVRDVMHRVGAAAMDAALEERKKRGTEDRVSSVLSVDATLTSKVMTQKS